MIDFTFKELVAHDSINLNPMSPKVVLALEWMLICLIVLTYFSFHSFVRPNVAFVIGLLNCGKS